jgi:hypothetical protein
MGFTTTGAAHLSTGFTTIGAAHLSTGFTRGYSKSTPLGLVVYKRYKKNKLPIKCNDK